jgi:protein translocase SEC61 complex gamma subunit
MGISDTLRSMGRVLRLAARPNGEEFSLSLRICALGLILVGVFGFIIQLLAALLLGSGA